MKVGKVDVRVISDGQVRLDGGSLFGVVPRTLWRNLVTTDRKNRATIGLNCLLVRTGDKNVLIDTGVGTKHPPRRRTLFAIAAGRLIRGLKQHGLEASDIDMVVLTHLHFDHAGGATQLVNGKLVPTFPKARYIVQQRDWAEATYTNDRTRPAYFPDDFLPLEESTACWNWLTARPTSLQVSGYIAQVATPQGTRWCWCTRKGNT